MAVKEATMAVEQGAPPTDRRGFLIKGAKWLAGGTVVAVAADQAIKAGLVDQALKAVATLSPEMAVQNPNEFNPQAGATLITPKNTVGVPATDLPQPKYESGNPNRPGTMSLPIPFDVPDGANIVLRRGNVLGGNMGLEDSTKSTLYFDDIPVGTVVHAPVNGRFTIKRNPRKLEQLTTTSRVNGAGARIIFDGPNGTKRLIVFNLWDAEPISEKAEVPWSEVNFKKDKGIEVKKGDPLFIITSAERDRFYGAQLAITVAQTVLRDDPQEYAPLPRQGGGTPDLQDTNVTIAKANNRAVYMKPST